VYVAPRRVVYVRPAPVYVAEPVMVVEGHGHHHHHHHDWD
jgi:hypothetical protein